MYGEKIDKNSVTTIGKLLLEITKWDSSNNLRSRKIENSGQRSEDKKETRGGRTRENNKKLCT